ncbi:MAG: hypothetical protein AB8B99_19375 [Phormidesmis sp.]
MKYQKIVVNGWLVSVAIACANLPAALASQASMLAQSEASPPAAAEILIEPVPSRDPVRALEDETLNLTPEVIEQSPVLQRWLEDVPDIRDDIRNDPSFVTRFYAGYSFFPSSDSTSGFAVGIEDLFIADTPLTFSADYQQNVDSNVTNRRQAYGADLHYYLFPLGDYFNVAPTVGYRYAESGTDYALSGANVGIRLRFVPSRTGAADVTLDQSWVVGDSEGLSITHLNVGYAVTKDLRISTDLEWQSTADEGDSRVGINLEWSL